MGFLILWFACAIIGAIIGSNKRMGGGAGFAWGLFLGIIGVIVVAASANEDSGRSSMNQPSDDPLRALKHKNPNDIIGYAELEMSKGNNGNAKEAFIMAYEKLRKDSGSEAEASKLEIKSKLEGLGVDFESYENLRTKQLEEEEAKKQKEQLEFEKRQKQQMITWLIIGIVLAVLVMYAYSRGH